MIWKQTLFQIFPKLRLILQIQVNFQLFEVWITIEVVSLQVIVQ